MENTTNEPFHSLFPEMSDDKFFEMFEMKKRGLRGDIATAMGLEWLYRKTFPNSFCVVDTPKGKRWVNVEHWRNEQKFKNGK